MTIVLLVLAIVAGAGAASTACGVNMVFTFHASLDRLSWWRASAAYLGGSLVGASAVGVLLAVVGLQLHQGTGIGASWPDWALVIVLVVGAVLGAREVGLLRFRLPQRASQLNSDGLHAAPTWRLFGFGAWLGTAFLTYSPYGGLHLLRQRRLHPDSAGHSAGASPPVRSDRDVGPGFVLGTVLVTGTPSAKMSTDRRASRWRRLASGSVLASLVVGCALIDRGTDPPAESCEARNWPTTTVSCTEALGSVSMGMRIDRTRIWLTTLGAVDAQFGPKRQVANHPTDPATPVWVFVNDGYRPPIKYADENGTLKESAPEQRVIRVVSAVDRETKEGAFLYIYGWSELGAPELPGTMPNLLAGGQGETPSPS